jgi:hypothetical protein
MQPRDVPVAHNAPRINDERKVRPHAAGTPALGIRPDRGDQKGPKKPAIGTSRMELRDVPVELMTEEELREWQFPWNRSPQRVQGNAIGYEVDPHGNGPIRLYHVQNGRIAGPPVEEDSYDTITKKVGDAWRAFEQLRQQRALMSSNPRRAARKLAQAYAEKNGMQGAQVGEIGREIGLDYSGQGFGGGGQQGGGQGFGGGGQGDDMAGAGPAPIHRIHPGMRSNAPASGDGTDNFWDGVGAPDPAAKPRIRVPVQSRQMPGGPPAAAAPQPAAPEPMAANDMGGGQQMPLPGIPIDKIDEILAMANHNGVDKGQWTAARIAAASELNRRQAAQKLLLSKHTHANAMAAESVIRESHGMHVRRAIETCKGMGMHCSHDRSTNEFRVNHPHNDERTAYYTDDPDDAIGTARHMKASAMSESTEDDDFEEVRKKTDRSDPPWHKGHTEGDVGDHEHTRSRTSEGYPEPSFDAHLEPAHSSKISDRSWSRNMQRHPHAPREPDLNREFAQFRELPVEKVTEKANADMDDMLEAACAMLGYTSSIKAKPEKKQPKRVHREGAMARQRGRFVVEDEVTEDDINEMGKYPVPGVVGSGKDFRQQAGTNKSPKQPGNLMGGNSVNKVKPGFVGG